jgi:glyoxylase-like metal-dependent hydrolase (beta-lactamase superfamily II)
MQEPRIQSFFDPETFTVTHVVSDPVTRRAAIIDSVLDYDPKSGRTSHASADRVIEYMRQAGLTLEWLLETHAHADRVMYTPGHTPACLTFVMGKDAFIGDTLFMPDYGSARCDFPGGDAATLYRSIKKILALAPDTQLHLCHDYPPEGRGPMWRTTVMEQREKNIHVHDGVTEAEFVNMRTARDKTLSMPTLLLPAVQVNVRAGRLPPPEDNGVSYLKIPVNAL